MSWVDIILLLALVAVVFVCFSAGLLRVASVLLGMYLGLQIAAIFYKLFANLTAEAGNQASITTNQVIWFGILWVVWSIILSLVVISFTKTIAIPKKLANFDQIGGMALGIFVAIFGILIMAFVIRNTVFLAWRSAGQPNNYLYGILEGFSGSLLMNVLRGMKVVFLNYLSPWLPSNEIPVFSEF